VRFPASERHVEILHRRPASYCHSAMQHETQAPFSLVSLLIAKALVVLDGIAVTVAFVILMADLIGEQPLTGLGFVLIPAIPLLAVGQIWMIVTMNSRRTPRPKGLLGKRISRSIYRPRDNGATFFGGLSRRGGNVVMAGFVLAWLLAMTAVPWITNGNPASGTPRCPWQLDNRDVFTCVSHHTYLSAGASEQRFLTGILMGFYVAHFGVAQSEVKLRQRPASTS
jgi:hypothetical protein